MLCLTVNNQLVIRQLDANHYITRDLIFCLIVWITLNWLMVKCSTIWLNDWRWQNSFPSLLNEIWLKMHLCDKQEWPEFILFLSFQYLIDNISFLIMKSIIICYHLKVHWSKNNLKNGKRWEWQMERKTEWKKWSIIEKKVKRKYHFFQYFLIT